MKNDQKLIKMEQTAGGLWLCQIEGSQGTIEIRDLVWITDRQDLLEIYYWSAWAVLTGAYHCCLSIPGKVSLLPPNEPR
jgi:hypothetical protein